MNSVLFYFSGTGNTFWITKKVGEILSSEIIPIAKTIDNEEISVQEDVVGIVTPVYYGDLPLIVREFLMKLCLIEGKYLFLIVNYGGGAGVSVSEARRIVKMKGGAVSMVYSIHMPQNAFYKKSENHEKIYSSAEKLLSTIKKRVEKGKRGRYSTNMILDYMLGFTFKLLKPQYKKHLINLTSLDDLASVEDAIYLADTTFSVNDNCNACGTCKNVCPVNNVLLIDGKPNWQHHCENCLACYNLCPQKAIYGPLVEKDYYYKHPEIKISDLINQKNAQ